MVAMCCGSKESATAEGQYEESKDPGKVRLPSRSWILKKLGEVRDDCMLKRCRRMLRRTVVRAKRRGMLRDPVIVAIAEHDVPFHAKVMKMGYAIFTRGQKGHHTVQPHNHHILRGGRAAFHVGCRGGSP